MSLFQSGQLLLTSSVHCFAVFLFWMVLFFLDSSLLIFTELCFILALLIMALLFFRNTDTYQALTILVNGINSVCTNISPKVNENISCSVVTNLKRLFIPTSCLLLCRSLIAL